MACAVTQTQEENFDYFERKLSKDKIAPSAG